jgi:hypothetical protein
MTSGTASTDKLLRALSERLESRGLDVSVISDSDRATYFRDRRKPDGVTEIVVTNSADRERGQVRIDSNGNVVWEYSRDLDEPGIARLLNEVTNALRSPFPRMGAGLTGLPADRADRITGTLCGVLTDLVMAADRLSDGEISSRLLDQLSAELGEAAGMLRAGRA